MHSASPAWSNPTQKKVQISTFKKITGNRTCSSYVFTCYFNKLQRKSTALIWDLHPNLQVELSRWLITKENGITTFVTKSTLFLSLASLITTLWFISFRVSNGWGRDPSLSCMMVKINKIVLPTFPTKIGRTHKQIYIIS